MVRVQDCKDTLHQGCPDTEGCNVSQKVVGGGSINRESLHHPCIACLGVALVTFFVCWTGDKDAAMS